MKTSSDQSAGPSLAWAGARLGAQVSVLAVVLYSSGVACHSYAVPVIRALRQGDGLSLFSNVGDRVGDMFAMTLFFTGFGTLPALVIGVTTGCVIGRVLQRNLALNTPGSAWLLGSTVCLFVTLFLNVCWLSFFTGSSSGYGPIFDETYTFLFGIPSLIYLLLGGPVGMRLYWMTTNSSEG
jgi:hypothetical protein